MTKQPNTVFGSDNLLTGRTEIESGNSGTGFNTDDFDVTNNVVSLKNKTSYYSIDGTKFDSLIPDVADITKSPGYILSNEAEDRGVVASVELPQGAVITAINVYGSDITQDFYLKRTDLVGGANQVNIASGNINTEETVTTYGEVDNSLYIYAISTNGLANTEKIYGARITYTTDYD